MSTPQRWSVVAVVFVVTYVIGGRLFSATLRRSDPIRREIGRGRAYDPFLADHGQLLVILGVLATIVDGATATSPRFCPLLRDAAAGIFAAWCVTVLWVDARLARIFRDPEGPVLATDGPYGWVRHPRYLCWMGILVSFAVVADSTLGVVLAAAFFTLVLRRIAREERFLRSAEPRYAAYAARTYRLVPWVY